MIRSFHLFLLSHADIVTNAHLLRPFLESPPGDSFTPSADSTPTSHTLLFDDAIRLKSHVQLRVRIDSTQIALSDVNSLPSSPSPSWSDDGWFHARLIYVSQGAWDVAILKVDGPTLFPITVHPTFRSAHQSHMTSDILERCLPKVGSNALVIGHALFPPASALLPTVTAGVLSKVVHLSVPSTHDSSVVNKFPALLVTSAAVHNGNSGGLLVDADTGYLLGMVTSNVMHTPVDPNSILPVHVRIGADSYASEERQTELQQKYDEAIKIEEEARLAQMVPMILPHLNFR